MKEVDDYMKMPYSITIIPDHESGGFVVSFPDLPGCLSCGETIESAIANAKDAQKEWLIAAMEEGIAIPEPNSEKAYSGQFVVRVPRSLHKLLAENAKMDGVSLNQYCVYLLSQTSALSIKNVWFRNAGKRMYKCKVVAFVSREKDNAHLAGFKERQKIFLWDEKELPFDKFSEFVSAGVEGEVSRLYISVNARDMVKTRLALLDKLAKNPTFNLMDIETLTAKIAMEDTNKAEDKMCIYVNTRDDKVGKKLRKDLLSLMQKGKKGNASEEEYGLSCYDQPNGCAYVTDHTYDCDKFMRKWKDKVTLKEDGMLLMMSYPNKNGYVQSVPHIPQLFVFE